MDAILRIVRALVLPALCAAAILALAPVATGEVAVRAPSAEFAIVDAQLSRARTLGPTPVVFIGDSSCLMGIDAPALAAQLALGVHQLCTLGFLGPAGYAAILERLQPDPRGVVIVMLHGVSLPREPAWEFWPAYARGEVHAGEAASRIDEARLALWSGFQPVVFPVLPGPFGRRYGSERAVREAVSHESLVDPSDRVTRQASAPSASSPNAAFVAAAPALREAIARSQRRAYLVMAPSPCCAADASPVTTAATVAALLGIPPTRVLPAPTQLDARFFASASHLNAAGRSAFTAELAPLLRAEAAR